MAALVLPALPDDLRAEVARGEASWTIALGPLVPDLDTAQRVAFVGRDGIYELEGFEREVLQTVDETRPLGLVVGGKAGRRLGDSELLHDIRRRSLVALALEACGVGSCALEHAIDHASTREQFGRPIGVYQAISHPLASSYAELELARSAALWPAWCVAVDDGDATIAAASAKALAADTAVIACERSIQIHGGIGFTWEHVLHRLYKRALGIQAWEASVPSCAQRLQPTSSRAHRLEASAERELMTPTSSTGTRSQISSSADARRIRTRGCPLKAARAWPRFYVGR